MIARLRKPEDLVATMTCFGIAGLSLAFGMWVAGQPLTVSPADGTIACVAPCGGSGPEGTR